MASHYKGYNKSVLGGPQESQRVPSAWGVTDDFEFQPLVKNPPSYHPSATITTDVIGAPNIPPLVPKEGASDGKVRKNLIGFLRNGLSKVGDAVGNIIGNLDPDDFAEPMPRTRYHVTPLNPEGTMQLMFDPVDVAFDVETVMQVPNDLKRNATVRDVIKANPKASKRVEKLMNDLQARTGIPMRHNIELNDPQGQRIEPATKRIATNASQSVLKQNQMQNQQRQREQQRQQNQYHNMQAVSHATPQGGGLANIARGNFNPYDPMSSVGFNPYQNAGLIEEDLNQIQNNLSFGARPVTQADRNRMRQANYQAQQNQAGMMAMAQAQPEQTRVMQQQLNEMRRHGKPLR